MRPTLEAIVRKSPLASAVAIPRFRPQWLDSQTIAHAVFALLLMLTSCPIGISPNVAGGQEFIFEPSWQPPSYEQVRAKVFSWIDESASDPIAAEEARSLWPAMSLRTLDGPALLDLVVETVAILDERARKLLAECNEPCSLPTLPNVDWLASAPPTDFAVNNLRLYAARWFAQHAMYDDTLQQLADLQLADVVDPASLLFYQMVAHHQLVEPDQCRAELVQLLEREDQIPLRYRQIAQLVQQDLSGLEDGSLDHVSRHMNDVRRRLDLGEAGKTVQVEEKGIVDSLDKIIKRIEQQQQQSSSSASGSAQSSTPMQDSQLPSLHAPGRVDPKDIGSHSGWGNLPPKEREEALQQIGREFPAHYRQLIEQYFRDLADEAEKTGDK